MELNNTNTLTNQSIKSLILNQPLKFLDSEILFNNLKKFKVKKNDFTSNDEAVNLYYYLNNFLYRYSFFYGEFSKDINLNFIFIDEKPKQTYFTITDSSGKTSVNYSIGLVLCASGLSIRKVYKPIKKQKKGLIKTLNFSRKIIFDRVFSEKSFQYRVAIVVRGKSRYPECYKTVFSYLKDKSIPVVFVNWLPKIRFSFVKMKKYGRIKRNLKKRIVKSIVSSDRSRKKCAEFYL